MTRAGVRLGLVAAMAAALAGCGSQPDTDRALVPATAVTAPPSSSPTTTVVVKPPPARLGPEWTQRDGRVLIEATASGDARTLLRDLEALGLTEGVVFGRVVNGWLPVGAFDAAQRLASLQLVRPTGAGTG